MIMTTSTTYGTQRTSTTDWAGPSSPGTSGDSLYPTALLPEPVPCGLCDGSMAALSMLLTQADEQDRAASRQIESAADQVATREENDRVSQLQAKAGADESQAVASGVAGIVGGALTVAGAFVSGPGPSSAASGSTHSTDWHQLLSGLSGGAQGAGGVVAGLYKGASDRADAEAARYGAQAQADVRRYDRAHDDAQAANQSIQKVEQFLDQIQQTENATRLTAATYRG
jgi:hypothetical protein